MPRSFNISLCQSETCKSKFQRLIIVVMKTELWYKSLLRTQNPTKKKSKRKSCIKKNPEMSLLSQSILNIWKNNHHQSMVKNNHPCILMSNLRLLRLKRILKNSRSNNSRKSFKKMIIIQIPRKKKVSKKLIKRKILNLKKKMKLRNLKNKTKIKRMMPQSKNLKHLWMMMFLN